MPERFFVDALLRPGPVILDGPEAHHLSTVCRLRPGDSVCLFNGDGHEYHARVTAVEKRQVILDVETVTASPRELGFHLEVAAPLPKGDRAQFLLEKLTELGVTSFVPLQTRRSVVQPREAKLDKLRRWVIEASKQCGRNVLLEVQPLMTWEEYCRGERPARRFVAHPDSLDQYRGLSSVGRIGNSSSTEDGLVIRPTEEGTLASGIAAAVGPEGGFTNEEVELARSTGWQVVGLGPRILRVETAALVLATWAGLSPSPQTLPPQGEGLRGGGAGT